MVDQREVSDMKTAIADYPDPETGRGIGAMGQIHEVRLDNDRGHVLIGLTTHSAVLWKETQAEIEQLLREKFPGRSQITVEVEEHERPPEKLGEIGLSAKSVVAVASGKGGVGKSTIAAAIAYGLRRAGSRVGLLDADVYGPSIPHLLGVSGQPEIVDNKIEPIEKDGLRIMSMGLMVPPGEAVVWRGPMLHGAMTQFLRDTRWRQLDYLLIDLPPGTGDVALSLSQLLPLTGAIVVCTPQDVALLDALKAIAMFEKVEIPVLGMVENMSGFVCPDCNKRYDIFGSGGARNRASELGVPFLGEVPIQMQIRLRGDEGRVPALFDDSATAPYLEALDYQLVKNLARASAASPPMPTLSVL
jgi:ATP-binding protein involved in chromosome partitioning